MKKIKFNIVYVVIVLFIFLSVFAKGFFSAENIIDILKANAVLGILSCGMMVVIISGGIDISVGAEISACSCVMAIFLKNICDNIGLGLIVSCIVGVLIGFLNGVFIAKLHLNPLAVTLGTCGIINGTMVYLTNGSWIINLPNSLIKLGRTSLLKIPIQVWVMILIIIVTYLLLKYTIIGRGVYSIGYSEEVARLYGYNPTKIKILIYSYMGLLSGVAALVHTTIMSQVDPNAFKGYEMKVISVVVLGGISITGGYGKIHQLISGLLFIALTMNGLVLLKTSSYMQSVLLGIVMILAIVIDARKNNSYNKALGGTL